MTLNGATSCTNGKCIWNTEGAPEPVSDWNDGLSGQDLSFIISGSVVVFLALLGFGAYKMFGGKGKQTIGASSAAAD